MFKSTIQRPAQNSFIFSSWLFLRLLGVIYFIAFVSLWFQVMGLFGSDGILPIAPSLEAASSRIGFKRFFIIPSVFWFNAGDMAMHWACGLGVFFSFLLIVGIIPACSLLFLWMLYLSFLTVSQTFLSFQWDILLLEAGFLSIFLAPWRWTDFKPRYQPSRLVHWFLKFLLFKLMFQSGLVKILSRDDTWRELTALTYHYMTQPIPNPVSWYVHQWPVWFHKLSTGAVFVIELILPFFVFLPRWGRLSAFIGLAGLQVLIMLSGNYAFFNLLTLTLCVLLLDDKTIRFGKIRNLFQIKANEMKQPGRGFVFWFKTSISAVALFLIVLMTTGHFVRMLGGPRKIPGPLRTAMGYLGPYALSNSYGLFAVMTVDRPEIILEGSRDGRSWEAYGFHWKPGDVKRRPGQVAPHQPRLDWQMWFAALRGNCRRTPWFLQFEARLLENDPAVLRLLAHNPFPDKPPKFIRARLYRYEFTTSEQRKQTGDWWTRQLVGDYCPNVSLNP